VTVFVVLVVTVGRFHFEACVCHKSVALDRVLYRWNRCMIAYSLAHGMLLLLQSVQFMDMYGLTLHACMSRWWASTHLPQVRPHCWHRAMTVTWLG
jgi:hypothetical protein